MCQAYSWLMCSESWHQTENCNWSNACYKKIPRFCRRFQGFRKTYPAHICTRHIHSSVHKPGLYCKIAHMLWQSVGRGGFWCLALHTQSCIQVALLCVNLICKIWLCHFEIHLIVRTSFSVQPFWLDKWFPNLKVFLNSFMFQSSKNKTLEC